MAFDKKYLKLSLTKMLLSFISDQNFIKIQYRIKTGNKLRLDEPRTYNEKLQWMKLYYHEPMLKICVDKYEVRSYVEDKIGAKYLIPILGLYNEVSEIDFSALPSKYILKLTNGSSFNHISYGDGPDEVDAIKSKFRRWIKTDYYSYGREWAYKDVKNRIICEELLETASGSTPDDHKFFCFNGRVEYFIIDFDSVDNGVKTTKRKRNIYDRNGKIVNGRMGYPNKDSIDQIEMNNGMKEMILAAEKLSKAFPAVRVDFYYFDEKIFFGELTFYHASGYQKIAPETLSRRMGDLITLPATTN